VWALRSQLQVGATHCRLEGGLAAPDALWNKRAVPIKQDICWFLSCRPVQRAPCRRQGGQVQCTDLSSVRSQGGAQSCVGSAMEAIARH
jgi:hypothetical protein